MNKRFVGVTAAVVLAVLVAGCGNNNSTRSDARVAAASLQQFDQAQPVPKFGWSQVRQNLIEIQSAEANTTRTTSFFFVRGGAENAPIAVCPSIGFPIPVTDQLTNPQQRLSGHESTIPQIEQTGVYSGDSSGTDVVCLKDNGQAYINRWEGDVMAVTGTAHFDSSSHQVVMTGASTVHVTTSR